VDLLTLLVLWALVAWNYARVPDTLYPPFLQSIVWAAVCTLYIVWGADFPPINAYTQIIFVLGTLMFTLGGALATFGYRPTYTPVSPSMNKAQNAYLLALLFVSWLLVVPILLRAEELSSGGIGDTAFTALRYAVGVELEGYGVIGYALSVSLFCTIGHLVFYRSLGASRLIAAIAPTVVYSGMFAGRTAFFTTLIAGIGVLAIMRQIRVMRALLLFLIVGFLLFVSIGIALNKAGSYDESIGESLPEIVDALQTYLLGALPAFDYLRERSNALGWGINTFRSVLAFGTALGIPNLEVVPLVKEFVFVPTLTNVYTVYQPYYEDFGFTGALVFPFGFGYLHSIAYRKSSSPHGMLWIIAYAMMMYPLFMQFFQDQYFSLLSFWVQLSALLMVLVAAGKIGANDEIHSQPKIAVN
jgi:oligosaccharide repeat unit polymerase